NYDRDNEFEYYETSDNVYSNEEVFEKPNFVVQQDQAPFMTFNENQEYNEFESYYILQEAGNYIN
ncbi:16232_t:CDS:2, partial [Racocetra persica]